MAKKQKTRDDYYKRIDGIIQYIYNNLDSDLSLEHLSGIACFAPYHFHRIFQSMLGQTINKYVRSVRLERAAVDIVQSTLPIGRVSKRAGYDNTDSFTRRFTKDFGMSPRVYREKASLVASKVKELAGQMKNMFDIDIKETEDITIAAMDHKGDYKTIGQVLDRMKAYMNHKNLFTPKTRAFAIFYDDPDVVEKENLRSKAGFTVSDDFEDDGEITKHVIPGGKYACINYEGPYAGLENAYKWFYGNWLVNSRYDIDHSPAIEEYLDGGKDSGHDSKTIIHISLK